MVRKSRSTVYGIEKVLLKMLELEQNRRDGIKYKAIVRVREDVILSQSLDKSLNVLKENAPDIELRELKGINDKIAVVDCGRTKLFHWTTRSVLRFKKPYPKS